MGNKKKKKPQLPFRLNILFLFVFVLFSLLILQLGVVQILNGEEAQKEIDKTIDTTSKVPVPRGVMYDRFGRIVLDNEPVRSITYTPPKGGDTAQERLDLAEKLAEYITLEENEKELNKLLRERDKKEYWYLFNADVISERLTEEEKDLDVSAQYRVMLEKITEEDLSTIDWTFEIKNIIAIKKELDQAFQLSPHIVKSGSVTQEEYAWVAEHLNELPGIDAAINWDRKWIYGNTFRNYIGSISTSDEGYPLDNADYYVTRGYSRNDRVGKSGLELQYESELKGRKEQVEYTTDKKGNIVNSEVVVDGKSGNDLILTVDIELQQQIDQIVKEELQTAIEMHPYENRFMKDALVAMMDPQTGEILALSGVRYDRENNEYDDESFRVIYDVHTPGSVVKGATLLAGLDSGVIGIGETILDTPINIAGQIKSSWTSTIGRVSDLEALERSSNIYMMTIAIRIAGASYSYGDRLRNFDYEAFQTMRNYFSQFGLGPKTGVDFPGEADSYQGSNPQAGNLLDFSIGQYDTFSTLQLAQYVSTIANDGYRVQPRLVKEIRAPEAERGKLGPVVTTFNPNVLNKIEMDETYLDRVQQGFIDVFHGSQGTATGRWSEAPYPSYKVAGKTGTAQRVIYEDGVRYDRQNLTLVGYAPYDNPEVAFAVVVPDNGGGDDQYSINHEIGKRIMDAYYNLKAERAASGVNPNPANEDQQLEQVEPNDEEVSD
ncbi:peptidoglycan D,D-transpeptidase FtsI family protein [Radiobacillus sp. PE A8.2]|uniref:peptidoglycan D,D-transpeptidase FtsI family protein n=1 Tax=Radiobacillus sp. PE A8.2 TaxID=3380349 RepID=UPI00388EDBDA